MRRALYPRIATLLALMCLVGVATYWALIVFRPASPPVPPIVGSLPAAAPPQDVAAAARLFGAVPTAADINVAIVGIIAERPGQRSSAVLSVDGKPGQAYPIGREIAPGVTLAEVRGDAIVLDRAGVLSEVPVPKRPAQDFIRTVE